MTAKYKLKKDFTDPIGTVRAGTIRDEFQWMARIALLNPGDCQKKDEWFERLEARGFKKGYEEGQSPHYWYRLNFVIKPVVDLYYFLFTLSDEPIRDDLKYIHELENIWFDTQRKELDRIIPWNKKPQKGKSN